MKVAILGAAGFLGRSLCEALASTGAEVIAATRRPATFGHPGIHNIVAPFADKGDFIPLLRDGATIVHAASISTPGSSAAQPQLDGNLRTTLGLLEALQESPDNRLLYISSGGTLYGDSEHAIAEDAPLRPRSYHAAGKIAAESFIRAWTTQYAGTAIILRPSNIYGPGQRPGSGFGVVPTAFQCALDGTPFPILGDGRSLRDYLYVDDFVALCTAALSADTGAGVHVYNAASGETLELLALLDRIDSITGKPLRRIFQSARSVDIRTIALDNSAAKAAFGWKPAMDMDEGLRRSWNWFRNTA
jgi:UDP-glucose 4-epimerase